MPNHPTLYTIGHSNHSIETFLDLLEEHQIQQVIDVRSTPYSKYTPWFDETELPGVLGENEVDYHHMGKHLGGRPTRPEHYGPNGQAQYDLMATSKNFQNALNHTIMTAREMPTAIMCTEKDPLRCHRTLMVCHELTNREQAKGLRDIRHILSDGTLVNHEHLMDQLLRNMKLEPEPRWLQVMKAVRTQADKVAYRRKMD